VVNRNNERRYLGFVVLTVALLLSACSGKRNRGNNDARSANDVEDIGELNSDAGDDVSDADGDADLPDTPLADASDVDPAADTSDTLDAWDVEPELDAVDVALDGDALDVEPELDAPDALDAADIDVQTDAEVEDADTVDAPDGDVGPDPETEIIKLVDPNAAPIEWFVGGSFGRAVSVDGDLMVLGADEDSAAGVSAGMVLLGSRSAGAPWVFERFVPDSVGAGDRFGSCAAVSGNLAVVGARGDSDVMFKAGAAYVLQRIGLQWEVLARLESPDPRSEGAFGQRCAIEGDRVAVASIGEGLEAGVVSVFERDGADWSFVAEFGSTRAVASDRFGASVALSDSRLLVADDLNRSVSIFDLDGDASPVIVEEPGEPQSSNFGVDIAVSANRFVVGAQQASVDGVRSGKVYVFRGLDVPVLEQELFDADRLVGDRFGASVDIDGDTIVTGAFRSAATAARSGIAYRFLRDGAEWRLEETLLPALLAGDRFGFEVAVSGGAIAVSAIEDDTVASDAGAVYVYERSEAAPPPIRVFSGNTAADDRFGAAVATDGRFIFVGSPFDQDEGVLSGAVHWFELRDGVVSYRGTLPHEEPTAGQGFGSSLSFAAGVLVVGATLDDRDGENAGSLYTFAYDEAVDAWSTAGTIRAPDAVAGGLFGERVAFDGELLLVGAPTRVDSVGSGGAWLYRLTDDGVWVLISRLDEVDAELRAAADAPAEYGAGLAITPSSLFVGAPAFAPGGAVASFEYVADGALPVALPPRVIDTPGATFGAAAASNGEEVLVTAPGEGVIYALNPGAATWFAEAVADSPEETGSEFGATLAFVSRSTIAVGAPNADAAGDTDETQASAGRVWVFQAGLTRWDTSPRVYEAPDASIGARFGESLSAAGDLFVAGAPGDDERGAEAGAAYVVIAP
jgi:hypothetical protein